MFDLSVTTYTLHPDNPCNTRMIDADGTVVYTVHTLTGEKHSTTTLYDAEEKFIAECVWGTVAPSAKVKFKDHKKTTMGHWMKESLLPMVHDVHFTDDDGRKYKWKGNEPGLGVSLKLYCADDGYKEVIAGFEKSRNSVHEQEGQAARLLFLQRGLEIRDLAVASFLFLERSVRINANDNWQASMMAGESGGWALVGMGKGTAI